MAALWFEIRARAAGGAPPADLPGMAEAVDAARGVEETLGEPRLWLLLDARAAGAASPAELVAALAAIPDSLRLEGGRSVSVREPAGALAAAVARAWPAWLEHAWPEREAALDPVRRRLQERLDAAGPALVRFLREPLGLPPPGGPLRVVLLPEAPPPGGLTVRTRDGVLSLVAVAGRDADALLEAVLHEALHQLEAQAPDGAGAFTRDLRARLRSRGVTPRDRLWRDLPHAVLFAHAGAAVRRFFAPEHRAHAASRGLYPRLGAAAARLPELWPRFLAGELGREELLDELAG